MAGIYPVNRITTNGRLGVDRKLDTSCHLDCTAVSNT